MKSQYLSMRSFWLILMITLTAGCSHIAHYPVNDRLDKYDPGYGYIAQNMGPKDNSEELLVILSFSGGGTRAAAFSYGVLEELRETEISIGGQKRPLIDEADIISGVSGGSFTAAYFGLFGSRIFEDYETRFLKKNIQGDLFLRTFLYPTNWFRLSSPFFDRSDLAAEFYDEYIFEHKTYEDMMNRKGPMVLINATDMALGTRFTFHQSLFNAICSDLSKFPVARACAASSAVPGVLTPIILKNYAGNCNFILSPLLENSHISYRHREMKEDIDLVLDPEKKTYFHLIDGGVADNLGLRAIEESVDSVGNIWTIAKSTGRQKITKVVFVVVNAETQIESMWNTIEFIPSFAAMISNYSSIAIIRYNRETMSYLQESFGRWAEQIRTGRCPPGQISKEPGSCGDIEFYLVDIRFENLKDRSEGKYLAKLPTSFYLPDNDVDRLRKAARELLQESTDFQKLLKDTGAMKSSKRSLE